MIDVMEILDSIAKVRKWVEDNHYRGYEPFDGLSSWARPLTFGNQLAERLLQQAVRQCPLNIRPILGIRPSDSTKGRGYMAWGYLTLYRTTKESTLLDKAFECLRWLDKHKVARFKWHSWSNHYDFASRGGTYTKDDPIIVWTSIIGHAFIDAYEITGVKWCLDIAESASNWIMELPREKTERGDCISYFHHAQSSIHNANMLGASLLARTGKHTGKSQFIRVARSAMLYSCSRQRQDGSWWYAEAPKYHWIDNFHTGYNLDSLDMYIKATGDQRFAEHLDKGLRYFKARFIETSGRPKYYHARAYPIDIQCAAQSIDTLARFAGRDEECAALASKVAVWTIRNMQHRTKGYFFYRQYPFIRAKTPMLHWGQATMFKALAELLSYKMSVAQRLEATVGSST